MSAPRRAALVVLSLLAAGAAAAQNAAAPVAQDSAAPPAAANGNPLAAIAIQSLSATRERPLFTPSRRPPAPPVVAAPVVAAPAPAPVEAPPETPPFKLIGTIVGGEESIAIFFNPATNATTRVHAGKEEAGWKVVAVNARAATLEKASQSVTLDLPKPGEASSAPAISAVPGLPTPEGEKMDPDP